VRREERTVPNLWNSVRAEWTKLRTIPSTAWLLLAVVAGMVGLGAMITALLDADLCSSPCVEDTTRASLAGVHAGQLLVAVLAVLAVSNEYGSGMVRTTLSAMPSRLRVLAAKALVVTAVALVVGALAVLGSLAVARTILPGHGFVAPSLAEGPVLRAAGGTTLYLGLIALLSLGVALLVRDAAVGLTVVTALLYLAPLLAELAPERVAKPLLTYAPMNAGLAVQATIGLDQALIGPWAGLAVLTVWTVGAWAAGAVRFLRSDSSG
jgi:ABC-2 type transport system permease protein